MIPIEAKRRFLFTGDAHAFYKRVAVWTHSISRARTKHTTSHFALTFPAGNIRARH